MSAYQHATTQRRRTPIVRVVVGLLVLLGLLFVGTDRAAAWFVGNSVESAVTLGGSDVQGARVDIHGFPFVTQLLRRDLNHVTLSLDSGAFGSYEFHNLTIDLHGLTPHPPWQAQQVEADTVVSYATVGQLLSQQLDREVDVAVAEEPGAVRASTEFVVLGAAVPVEVVFVPAIDAPRTVTADIRTVSLAGMEMDVSARPGPIADELSSLAFQVPLPEGVAVQNITVEPDGLHITAQAADIPLSSLLRN